MTALMPHFVPKRHLMRINSMDQSITSLSTIVGPALGILLYTYVGLHGVMLLDAFCAAIACLCLASVKVKANISPNNNHDSVFAELREGATFIYKDKGLRSLMLLIMFTMLLFMPVASLDPLMVYEHFKGDGFRPHLLKRYLVSDCS